MVDTVFRILALAAATMQFVAASPTPALLTVVAPFSPDSSPVSGTIVGVNSLGQTTYILSESTVESNMPLAATVTLIEGSDYMSYTLALPDLDATLTLGAACGIKDGVAVCTEAVNGVMSTETISAPGSWVIDVVATATPTAGGGGSSSAPAPTQTLKGSAPRTVAVGFGVPHLLSPAYALALLFIDGNPSGASSTIPQTGTLLVGSDNLSFIVAISTDGLAFALCVEATLQGENAVAMAIDKSSHIATTTWDVGLRSPRDRRAWWPTGDCCPHRQRRQLRAGTDPYRFSAEGNGGLRDVVVTAAPAPEFVTVMAPLPLPFSSQTFSASIMGVDGGHTTYALAQTDVEGDSKGVSSTVTVPVGTLVEGSDHVSYTFATSTDGLAFTAGVEFGVQSGNAIATVLDESSQVVTATIPVSSFASWVLDLPPTGAPGGPRPTNSAHRTGTAGFGVLVGLAVVWQLV
ncbi:hypothetical protein FB451DRAFT_1404859 [Mycena latifolia]|nr:hypothetical protein FB451DRAFT_1404859 [Mycena latifolia]